MTKSSEIVRSLRETPEVKKALGSVDQCWRQHLQRYVADLPPQGQQPGPKSIKDSVWGMIHLEGREVLVVDSPMFQRLRRVKQLGTTYYTFPTADYSRFEHALGVMHQATRMMAAIASRSDDTQRVDAARSSVRLACLLHDIGHLPMSHLSERHFTDFPDETFDAAHEVIEETLQISCQLSEVLSFLLIESAGFRNFLIDRCHYEDVDVDGAALAILGSPPPERKFLKQLISNVIDADKLDYMFRDSRYTSVPLPVDLDRLLFKLKLLPEHVTTESGKPAGGYLAIDLGGAHLIEDLIIARRILARQIYRHHKTLAAEQLVLSLLELTQPSLIDVLSRDDGYFVEDRSAPDVIEAAGSASSNNDAVANAIDELRFRRLPRRALARSFALLPRAVSVKGKAETSEVQRLAEMKLQQDLQLTSFRTELSRDTLSRFNELTQLLGRFEGGVSRVYFDGSTGPKAPDAELFIERPDGTVELYEGFPASAAAFAHSPEEFNYIFFSGKSEAAPLVHIATESVLFDKYGLTYGRGSADHAKINFGSVASLKREIECRAPDFFAVRGQLRPQNAHARDSAQANDVDKVYRMVKTYRSGIDKDAILRFLDQFPEAAVPGALKMLGGIQFVDDVSAAEMVKEVLATANVDESSVLVPLTPYGESSSVMAYHLRQQGAQIKLLHDAYKDAAKSIVLFEDSLLSGKQACSILLSWFGKAAESPDDAVDALDVQMQAWLRSCEITFVFSVGTDVGAKALEACATKLGLRLRRNPDNTAVVLRAMGQSKRLQDVEMNKKERKHLDDFLRHVGEALLKTTKMIAAPQKWTAALCEERALGYSGDGGLTVFKSNSPTSSVTALWREGGKYRNLPWKPLFPRVDPDEFVGPHPPAASTVGPTTGV